MISKKLAKGETARDMCICGHMVVMHALPEDNQGRRCLCFQVDAGQCTCKRFRNDPLAFEDDRMKAILVEVERVMCYVRTDATGEKVLKQMERAVKKIAKRGMR